LERRDTRHVRLRQAGQPGLLALRHHRPRPARRRDREGVEVRMRPTIRIFPDADQLARFAARLFLLRFVHTLTIQVQFTFALSGGSTPKKMFEILGGDERLKKQVKLGTWDYVHFFWGDERHVPPDHVE